MWVPLGFKCVLVFIFPVELPYSGDHRRLDWSGTGLCRWPPLVKSPCMPLGGRLWRTCVVSPCSAHGKKPEEVLAFYRKSRDAEFAISVCPAASWSPLGPRRDRPELTLCKVLGVSRWDVAGCVLDPGTLKLFPVYTRGNTSSLDATLAYATFRRNCPLLDSGEARVSCLSLWDKLPQRLDP